MDSIDNLVIERARQWHAEGHCVWLCTVLSTFGSSPRPPGSLLVARSGTEYAGSLSGGCVEEAFLAQLDAGQFTADAQIVLYGDGAQESQRLQLPCGGVLKVLVECLPVASAVGEHLDALQQALSRQQSVLRRVRLSGGRCLDFDPGPGATVEILGDEVHVRLGPVVTLILAGASPVARYCAQFATALGFRVLACDPREEAVQHLEGTGLSLIRELPSVYIARHGCHTNTAVVALTHDPRIDDLAMMEAVRTEAFYIGVMGSERTSANRAKRLQRVGGLSEPDIARIHMPIGLNLGSKTPPEIALAVMADILRVRTGTGGQAMRSVSGDHCYPRY
ncbi:XdhC family protein [Marinobacterium rhizophilum]|uniref:XdhC family protein n=1 Tax=Marinobacterium rhizophilum TaxID=420402 RepID=A0ABY5HJ43_9GAMM|nr:XdhC family protein [Marinobacterium rhizophilum]UTW11297.1 XdhC family protein [Marinobacterium rhizophilum]